MSVCLTQKSERLSLLFFTNVTDIPNNIDGINLVTFFQEHNIEVIHLELTNKTPKNWYKAWRNQFYVFDVLNYCQRLDGNILILDSDCFIRKSLTPIFDAIEKNQIITYYCGHGVEEEINGISIAQMRQLFEEYLSEKGDSLVYCGGEFIGINSQIIPQVLELYHDLWNKNYLKYTANQPKLNEEAHFLSLIYYKLGLSNSIANEYIRRIWTSIHYDNVLTSDDSLIIWHLPAEKKYGFQKFFKWFSRKERTADEIITYLNKYFFIHKKPIYRKMRKILYKAKDTLCRSGKN